MRHPDRSAPESVIIGELLAAEDGFVSGAGLARTLGMSRVAVWQHMEKLREQGYEFEAVRARGYRLIRRPDSLNAALIQAHRHAGSDGFALHLHDELVSTNDEAARLLAEDHPAPFAVIARRQTKGRGRFGRTWHSEGDGTLCLSVGFRPRLTPERMQTFTLWMGVNVCELVASYCRTAPAIKWPNDLLFDGRKLGGMLTEARMDADHIRDLVFGLGLNLAPPPGGWPEEISTRAISLAEHTRQPLDRNRFVAALLGRILSAYNRFADGSFTRTFADSWNRLDALRGRTVTVLQGPRRIQGTALGIDDEGSLIIRSEAGTERFRAGEVTFDRTA